MKILSLNNLKSDSDLKQPGVYKIFLMKKSKSVKIKRVIDDDFSGLLYIGAAERTNLEYRLNCFLKSMGTSKQNNHSAGNKICFNLKLQNYINLHELGYEIIPCKNAKEIEKQKLRDYQLNFGEVPPLNG